jgi:hypothetical protein
MTPSSTSRLREWQEIKDDLDAHKDITPLDRFIYDNEPAGDDQERKFRVQLIAALRSFARSESGTRTPEGVEPGLSPCAGTRGAHDEVSGGAHTAAVASSDKPGETPRTDELVRFHTATVESDWDALQKAWGLTRQIERELAEAEAELERRQAKIMRLTPSHVAQVSEQMPRTFEYLLNAMEAAAQAYNPHKEGYAEKRRAVFQHVEDLWSDYMRLLREKQDSLVPSATEERSLDDMSVQELQGLLARVNMLLQHKVCGDPSSGVTFEYPDNIGVPRGVIKGST